MFYVEVKSDCSLHVNVMMDGNFLCMLLPNKPYLNSHSR